MASLARTVFGCSSTIRSATVAAAASSSSSSSSSTHCYRSFFTASLPRRSQHESTQTPARTHRQGSGSSNSRDPMTGQPTNSSSQYKAQTASDSLNMMRDIASGAQVGPGGSGEAEFGADAQPGTLPSDASEAAQAGAAISAAASSSSSSSSSSAVVKPLEQALNPAGYGYTALTLPPKSDETLESFINHLQRDGKKSLATKQVLGMMSYLSVSLNTDPLPALTHAIELAAPMVRIQTKKQGAKNTAVPSVLNARQMRRAAIVGIIKASKKRPDREIEKRLAREVIAVLEGNSETLRKKEDVHRDAVRNRSNLGVRV